MLPRDYANQHCSVAATLEIVGDRWTLLVLREAFLGTRRFDDFRRNLGVARTILADRLSRLVAEGLLQRARYQERPDRFEYRLSEKGVDLWPVLIGLMHWGDRHVMGGRPPLVLRHRGCGGRLNERRFCEACGAALGPRDVQPERGAGTPAGARTEASGIRAVAATAGAREEEEDR